MEINGLSQFITGYIAQRKQPKLDAFEKEAEKRRAGLREPDEESVLEQQLFEERRELEKRYEVRNWLTDAAARAGQISLVTHAIKYFHGDAKGSSVFSTAKNAHGAWLSTATLKVPTVDAVGNSAALDVARLLQTEHEGDSLLTSLQRGDVSALVELAQSEQQCDEWVRGFMQALSDKSLSSHKLAKQIYFPVDDNGRYHLLSPLYSSSLAQALYQRIDAARFSEISVATRKARREKQWSSEILHIFSDVAVQGVGGTKPQNISYLNSARRGKSYLLRCAPPEWQSSRKPPVEQKTIFSPSLGRLAGTAILQLRRFLVDTLTKANTKDIRQKRAELVDDVIGVVFSYAADIQNLVSQRGWSARSDCQLNLAQQLWLDPERRHADRAFMQLRESESWQKEIANDFGHWLNTLLGRDEKLNVGKAELREFASTLLRKRLFEFDSLRQEEAP